jgi:hypothetical protein
MSEAYIDPGEAKDCALACFEQGYLASLDWVNAEAIKPVAGRIATQPDSILWEKPQIYPKSKGNPNQMVDLAVAGAEAVTYLRIGWGVPLVKVRSVLPRDWKGTIAKPVHHMRLWPILTRAERALFPADTWAYIQENAYAIAMGKSPSYSAQVVDLLDATALGCYDLGRLSGPLAGKVQALKAARSSTRTKGRRYGKR